MKNRLIEFDLMKGIGILLVILGHSVPDFPLNLRADNASRLIEEVVYGFHMPLFFVCSGFVMQMSEHKPNGGGGNFLNLVKSRSLRLLLPYMAFSFFSLGLRLAFSAFTRSSVELATSTYQIFFEGKFFWFLYVLFIVSILLKGLKVITKKIEFSLLFSFALYVLGLLLNTKFLCLDRLGYFATHTVAGCYLYEYRECFFRFAKKWHAGVCALLMFGLLFMLPKFESVVYMQMLRFLKAFTGVAMTLTLCLNHERISNRIKTALVYFGNYSLQYYLVHMVISLPVYYIVAKLPLPMPLMFVFANFVIITMLSFVIVKILFRLKALYPLLGLKRV